MEENVRDITNFLNADTNIRNALINNLGVYGQKELEEMSYDLIKFIHRVAGSSDNLTSRHIEALLFKNYGYGIERFVFEYDRGTLTDKDLTNRNFEIEEQNFDAAINRRNHIHNSIESLESRGHKCMYWSDFANRSYSEIRDKVAEVYGEESAKKFDYYGYYDLRDDLQQGLNRALNKSHDKTLEEMTYLDNSVKRLEDASHETRAAYRESLLSQFK